MNADVNVDEKDDFGNTALHLASSLPSPAMVMLLISGGRATINVENMESHTPFVIGCGALSVPVIKMLAENGASFSGDALQSVMMAGMRDVWSEDGRARFIETLRLVVKLGKDVDADIGARRPLHFVFDSEAIDILVQGGVGIDSRCEEDDTPLHAYLDCSRYTFNIDSPSYGVVQAFLRLGADPNAETPLLRYLSTGYPDMPSNIVDLLLREGADETLVGDSNCDAATYAKSLTSPAKETILGLLANAPADRAWRRRRWLVMLRRRDSMVGGDTQGESFRGVVVRLFGLCEEGLFQKIVGFL